MADIGAEARAVVGSTKPAVASALRVHRGTLRDLRTDLLAIGATLAVATLTASITAPAFGRSVWLSVLCVAVVMVLEFATMPAYERARSLRPTRHLAIAGAASLLAATAIGWVTPTGLRGGLVVIVPATIVTSLVVLVRRLARPPRATLLVGDRAGVGHLLAQWGSRTDVDVRGICLVRADGELTDQIEEVAGVRVVGALADAPGLAADLGVDDVVVAPGPSVTAYDVRRLSWALSDSAIELIVAVEVHGALPYRIEPRVLGRRLVLSVRPGRRPPVVQWVKALIDRVGAAVLIVAFSPVLITLAVMVRRSSPGPALFKQTRSGLDGHPFTMYKFRTMVTDAEDRLAELMDRNEGAGLLFKLRDDPRVTPVGRFLRRTSLDELPQLFNVLKGDMSLIGPRPGLPVEAAQYDDWIRRRLQVKPGMTGVWQVSGRSNLSWQDSVRLDIDYVDNWTLRQDLAIAARTARAVIQRDGAV
ncbi:exopolysaccharide biosynthesis polyprenyl glycosylphosphotransferase [Mumia flava]|uniref:Exopolysaccharide biosynthesis polyprenyl glycosylphosphotransferase n=1 Tax=Mumia flava TaxID=1348852 RepID=A0A2M9BFZ5_9ACTN|nr:sugar transferase [Mumia flava]PJJ56873.1 exopolysaccharide biosynthesis polyprenyl glycosylphosphotransferase [Mumia flava]